MCRGGDWRDEMQVKHDAKTIQEPRAATKYRGTAEYSRVQHRTTSATAIEINHALLQLQAGIFRARSDIYFWPRELARLPCFRAPRK